MRLRAAASVLALAAAMAGVSLLQPTPVTAAPHRSAVSARCSVPAPTTAAGYQAMFDAKNDTGWSGGDQAASLPLPDGRTLWLFADTIQGTQHGNGGYGAGARMVHSSFLLQDGGCLTAVTGPAGAEVVPNAANGDWYWPQSAVVENGELIVLAGRTRRTGPGSLDFRNVGHDAAVFSLPAGGRPVFRRMAPLPSTGIAEGGPEYGAALVTAGRWTYVYASTKAPAAYGRAVSVARVPAGSFLDLPSWRYWDGSRWTADRRTAKTVVQAAPHGWSTSFSVMRRPDGSFRYLTKADDVLGRDVVSGTFASPVAPGAGRVVAGYPSGTRPGEVFYNPLGHPELRLAGGGLLVSICRNNLDQTRVLAHADLYKPQFFTAPPL